MIDPFGLCAKKYDKSDLDVWGSGNFQSYLSALGFYNGKNDYNLFSKETQKALSNFNKVYGLSDDQKLGNILSKIVAAYTTYNKVISSEKLNNLIKCEKENFDYDDIQKKNFAKTWAFFEVGYSYNVTQISGVLGCINQESVVSSDNANNDAMRALASKKGINGYPKAEVHDSIYESLYAEDDLVAYGLIQWCEESRKKGLADYMEQTGLPVSDINHQLAFLRSEIDNKRNKPWLSENSAAGVAAEFNKYVIVGGAKETKKIMAGIIYEEFKDFRR